MREKKIFLLLFIINKNIYFSLNELNYFGAEIYFVQTIKSETIE